MTMYVDFKFQLKAGAMAINRENKRPGVKYPAAVGEREGVDGESRLPSGP
jgi:hypothetical protein